VDTLEEQPAHSDADPALAVAKTLRVTAYEAAQAGRSAEAGLLASPGRFHRFSVQDTASGAGVPRRLRSPAIVRAVRDRLEQPVADQALGPPETPGQKASPQHPPAAVAGQHVDRTHHVPPVDPAFSSRLNRERLQPPGRPPRCLRQARTCGAVVLDGYQKAALRCCPYSPGSANQRQLILTPFQTGSLIQQQRAGRTIVMDRQLKQTAFFGPHQAIRCPLAGCLHQARDQLLLTIAAKSRKRRPLSRRHPKDDAVSGRTP
jgi:hypothetical protein